MSAPETGTAPSPTAVRITSPAVPVASSAAPLRTTSPPPLTPTISCLGPVAASAVLVAATAPPGSPAIGSVPGQVATNTTLRVGWSVFDATLPEIPPRGATNFLTDPVSHFGERSSGNTSTRWAKINNEIRFDQIRYKNCLLSPLANSICLAGFFFSSFNFIP